MSLTIKILMIDDDEEDYMITCDVLAEIKHRSYSTEWVADYDDAIKIISQKRHDVYLIDYRLGAKNGLDLIAKAIERGCEAPLILLTGQNDIEIDEKAMKAGAADYLVKGAISPSQLESTIRYSIEHSKNIKEIKDLNAKLEKRVKDRTMILEEALHELEISREELSEALNKERELNELKSRFVSMASHEFRTPLTTILSSLSLVEKYGDLGDKEKQLRHIQRIKTSVTHMTEILNDVLSISKLEEGKILASPESFNINHYISQMLDDLKPLTRIGQLFIYSHDGNIEDVYIDKNILKNILFNLVTNAIKFSPEEKSIHISTSITDSEISLTIRDEGIGISDEDQKHLFERFFRGNNAVNIQGTGLGLSIVAKYVEMMDGTIEVKSKIEEGTAFTIKLPIKPEEELN